MLFSTAAAEIAVDVMTSHGMTGMQQQGRSSPSPEARVRFQRRASVRTTVAKGSALMSRSWAAYVALSVWLTAFGHPEVASSQQGQSDVQPEPQEPSGGVIFQNTCASCHDNGVSGAPSTTALHGLTASTIYATLTKGRMRGQAAQLSEQERRRVAEYLSGRSFDSSKSRGRSPKACNADAKWFDLRQDANRDLLLSKLR